VKTNFTQANAYLTAMKATEDLAWLNEVSSVPLQQAIRHQQVAYTNFFAGRARYPRFKSRTGRQSAEFTDSAQGRAPQQGRNQRDGGTPGRLRYRPLRRGSGASRPLYPAERPPVTLFRWPGRPTR
jgi:hypothetical protein